MSSRWNEKTIVITGGSRGLGLAIAKAFASSSAKVVLIGRNQEDLARAQQEVSGISKAGGVETCSFDITDEPAFESHFSQLVERLDGIDVWINCAGKSIRCDLADSKIEDYRELMEINFFAAARCSLAVLPHLKQSGGHLVNIGSLASKTAWPYVAPYSTSKHALAALTGQLRLEGPSEVHYLHVCTGPIARDDGEDRYRDQSADLGEKARQAGAGAPVRKIDPHDLAERIVRACEQRSPELVLPGRSKFLFALSQLSPRWGDRLLRRLARK
ncbi:MAG: SDR family NAD(P)-dependent oxidoreductase [Mariniblastus sp.]|nr:SDR family NAD(P)-dependent oxidoreductase [Mariniblastus sp.]